MTCHRHFHAFRLPISSIYVVDGFMPIEQRASCEQARENGFLLRSSHRFRHSFGHVAPIGLPLGLTWMQRREAWNAAQVLKVFLDGGECLVDGFLHLAGLAASLLGDI